MKTLLIINKQQFGYLTDVLKWSETLRHTYKIIVLCFDKGYKRINVENVDVIYVPYSRVYAINALMFFMYCIVYILKTNGVIVEYFDGCSIFKKLFPRRRFLLDIRTLSVSDDAAVRNTYNKKLLKTSQLYDHITVISQGIRQFLGSLPVSVDVLPLGAEQISCKPKSFDKMNLLYVGTLSGRDIHKTIYGIDIFCKAHPNNRIIYHIVGDGNASNELEYMKNLIESLNLSDKVIMHGRIPYDELMPFFDEANIGVSFVPITAYYEDQPSTKIYEYAMSGLYTIATATKENRKIINEDNGILIDDTAQSFYEALEFIYVNHDDILDTVIRNSVAGYKWPTLVHKYLLPILDSIY